MRRSIRSFVIVSAQAFVSMLLLAVVTGRVLAATLPSGFSETTVASGLSNPTLLAIAPDGRVFVSEQAGRLRVIKNGALLSTPFLTLTVNSAGERGLLGVAFDPAFATNRYIYAYYTSTSGPHNRVSRFRASATNPDVVEAGSEQQLLDLPTLGSSNFHNGGALQFGADGKLYVSVGENYQPSLAQRWDHTFGKILRINPDGTIPTDNPNYATQTGINRAAWARGFRNPFGMAVQAGTGRLFVNDAGNSASSGREEINNVVKGGNYNWPNSEGTGSFYSYSASSQGGCTIVGGDFYDAATPMFPSAYQNKYFYADYCAGWIKYIDPASATPSPVTFATGISSATDVEIAQDGSLYYIARGSGAVRRVRYGSGPNITQHPQSQTVAPGAAATFSVAATGAGTLRYQWQRNGGNIAGATAFSYSLTAQSSDNGAQFRCVVTDDRGSTTSNSATLTVTLGGRPTATVTAPAQYSAGESICYSGDATDPEDGTLPASAFTWNVVFHHDTHTHPFQGPITGVKSGCFTVPTSGDPSSNVWFRISLSVVDSDGQSGGDSADVRPRTVRLTLATNPPGLQLTLDGAPVTAPSITTEVVGMDRAIGTTSPQGSCVFQSWSDGGAITHTIRVPSSDATYTATFTGCGSSVYSWPEAESGTVSAPMQSLSDTAASGGRYIQVAAGSNSTASAPSSGYSTIPFSVGSAGTYKVWGRVIAPTTSDDSFWIRMDGGSWIKWNEVALGSTWHWDDVSNSDAGNAVATFSLAAGSHTITVAYREDGTRLDRLLITNDLAFTPTGTGPSDPTPTPTPTPTPGGGGFAGYYRIMARHSGKAVVVQSASTAEGANIFQWTYGGSATNDEWEIRGIGSGFYRIINRRSGKDMAVQGASTAEGANIAQFTYTATTPNYEWEIADAGGGYFRITNRLSGKAAEVVGGGTADGTNIAQRTYGGSSYQQFQIISVP